MAIKSDTPLDTRTALLHAVRDNPEADDPRLQLADYLDEHADDRVYFNEYARFPTPHLARLHLAHALRRFAAGVRL